VFVSLIHRQWVSEQEHDLQERDEHEALDHSLRLLWLQREFKLYFDNAVREVMEDMAHAQEIANVTMLMDAFSKKCGCLIKNVVVRVLI